MPRSAGEGPDGGRSRAHTSVVHEYECVTSCFAAVPAAAAALYDADEPFSSSFIFYYYYTDSLYYWRYHS